MRRKEDPYAFFTQSLRTRKFNFSCCETLGCPKYDQLRQTIVEPLASCGFHLNDNIHHCPMTECHAFWLWFQTYAM